MGRAVRDRPIPGALALAFVAIGLFGDPYLSIPDAVDALLFLTGALLLFYLTRSTGGRQ